MTMKTMGIMATMGIGAAAGAVAVMMMPRTNPARKLVAKAADKVEIAACKAGQKAGQKVSEIVDMD